MGRVLQEAAEPGRVDVIMHRCTIVGLAGGYILARRAQCSDSRTAVEDEERHEECESGGRREVRVEAFVADEGDVEVGEEDELERFYDEVSYGSL